MSASGGNFVISFININKYTSASENVHLCLSQKRQLDHISVAAGRIPSLFCVYNIQYRNWRVLVKLIVNISIKDKHIV